jgi:hypothetical protein
MVERYDTSNVTTREEQVCDLYTIPSKLEFRDRHKPRANTHATVEVMDSEPNGKQEDRSKSNEEADKPSKNADCCGK